MHETQFVCIFFSTTSPWINLPLYLSHMLHPQRPNYVQLSHHHDYVSRYFTNLAAYCLFHYTSWYHHLLSAISHLLQLPPQLLSFFSLALPLSSPQSTPSPPFRPPSPPLTLTTRSTLYQLQTLCKGSYLRFLLGLQTWCWVWKLYSIKFHVWYPQALAISHKRRTETYRHNPTLLVPIKSVYVFHKNELKQYIHNITFY